MKLKKFDNFINEKLDNSVDQNKLDYDHTSIHAIDFGNWINDDENDYFGDWINGTMSTEELYKKFTSEDNEKSQDAIDFANWIREQKGGYFLASHWIRGKISTEEIYDRYKKNS